MVSILKPSVSTKGEKKNQLNVLKIVDKVQSLMMNTQAALTFFSFESLLIVSVVGGWDRLLVSEGNVLKTGERRD